MDTHGEAVGIAFWNSPDLNELKCCLPAGSTSLLMNVWFPFLPLYMLQVGARDEASALLWVAIGASAQGAGRLIGGVMLALAVMVAFAVREPAGEK